MPINNIPGVGPTNADIATAVAAPSAATIAAAVAAPSAATIAAAVAAPSAATIAAAVAAPSSATIASAVAAAVPTLSQINTSVANNAPSPNNWTVIGSAAMNNSNSYTFSSISGYKTLRLVAHRITRNDSSGVMEMRIRFNGDTTAGNYAWYRLTGSGGSYPSAGQSIASETSLGEAMYVNSGNGGALAFDFSIENANSTAITKSMIGSYYTAYASLATFDKTARGFWHSTAAINSITIFMHSTGTTAGQPIYLLGAN